MKARLPWLLGGGALLVIVICTALLAWWRLEDARQFGQTYQVHTYTGTNYVFQFVAATVGKVETGCVLIVTARIVNPDPFPLTLQRDWFILATTIRIICCRWPHGAEPHITIPANGVAEREALDFVGAGCGVQGG